MWADRTAPTNRSRCSLVPGAPASGSSGRRRRVQSPEVIHKGTKKVKREYGGCEEVFNDMRKLIPVRVPRVHTARNIRPMSGAELARRVEELSTVLSAYVAALADLYAEDTEAVEEEEASNEGSSGSSDEE
ncbi:hypothetical protein MMC28_007775 [Mycoblastus sanguinarius]|nr:hypothetical protein [Mycoblastus sanguinarius]